MSKTLMLLICILVKVNYSYCQGDSAKLNSEFVQQDLSDWIAMLKSKPPPAEKNSYLLVMPYISANPTAGVMLGLGFTFTYKKNKSDQYLSVFTANASYSTNKLVNTSLKSNMYIYKGKLNLNGDWRFLINNETTYGLGTDKFHNRGSQINGIPTENDSIGQNLTYNQIRFYEIGSLKVVKNLFAGVGFQYDRYTNIKDEMLENGDTSRSIHHRYSKDNKFDYRKYTVVGVSVNVLYDSRDNQVNAYQGYFMNLNYRFNLTGLGSTQNSTLLLAEYRSFHPLDGEKKRHIMGVWLYGNFVTSGSVPYLALPALGYDQRQRTGRGYKFGQFRGNSLVYGEAEYRFPISKRTGILGGDVFFNATTTSDKKTGVMIMDDVRFGYGGGLRIMLDKHSRTRLAIDLGISPGTVGFYFGAQETF